MSDMHTIALLNEKLATVNAINLMLSQTMMYVLDIAERASTDPEIQMAISDLVKRNARDISMFRDSHITRVERLRVAANNGLIDDVVDDIEVGLPLIGDEAIECPA